MVIMREKLRPLKKSAQPVACPLLAIQQMDLLHLLGISSRHNGLVLSFCPYHFIFFLYLVAFDCTGSSLMHRLSLVGESMDCPLLVVCRLLVAVASLVEHGLWSTASVVVLGLAIPACGIFLD